MMPPIPVLARTPSAPRSRGASLSWRASRAASLLLRAAFLIGVAATLAGCEAAALAAFGVGASTGVQHTLNGITYRTFTAPESKVKGAAMLALNRMGIKPVPAGKGESGELIRAKANDRDIEVGFEALSPNTTRMRTVAKQGLFYDSATAYEIIIQTEKALAKT